MRDHGMLSTRLMLDRHEVDAETRRQVYSSHRPTSVVRIAGIVSRHREATIVSASMIWYRAR